MTLALLIPVKELSNAKQRLAGLLTQAECSRLARIMLVGVLRECVALPAGFRRVMATSDRSAMELAQAHGFEVLEELSQESESTSVDRASTRLEAEGVRGVLRVPLDLPLIAGAELMRLAELAEGGMGCILVPSLDGTGTNGLYRAPPTAFPSRFGPGSLALHEALAREHTASHEVVPLASLALDIDEPGDVAELFARGEKCPTLAYLEEIGVPARLENQKMG